MFATSSGRPARPTGIWATAARVGVDFADFEKAAVGQIPVGRAGHPEDVANTVSFLVSEGAGFVSGQIIYVAGGPRD